MNYEIKKLRKRVLTKFLIFFIGHIFIVLPTYQITTNKIEMLEYQFCWFVIYFSISFCYYVFAPKIIKKEMDGRNGA